MPEQTQPKKERDPLNTQEVAIKAFNKKVEEHVGNVVDEAIASPGPTDFKALLSNLLEAYPAPEPKQVQSQGDILKQLVDLAATPIPTGEKMNPVASLIKKGQFKTTDVQEPLGIDDAAKIMELQMKQEAAAGDIPGQQLDIIRKIQNIIAATPEGAAAMEVGKKRATARFEEAEKQRIFKADIDTFIKGFESTEKELVNVVGPEVLETGIGGKAARGIASVFKEVDLLPKTSAFVANIKVNANKMARTVEGGRVTDKDRQVYADALANSLTNPSKENTELVVTSLRQLKSMGGDISQQVQALFNSKSKTLNEAGKALASREMLEFRRQQLLRKRGN
jgi:hypothetical protein